MRSLRRNGHPNHLLDVGVFLHGSDITPCRVYLPYICYVREMLYSRSHIFMLARRVMPSFFDRMSHIALFPRLCAVIVPERVLIDIRSDVVDIITNVLGAQTP